MSIDVLRAWKSLIISYPGLWTLFAMLGTSAVLVCILWYRLGGSADYKGPSQEQVESKAIDDTLEPRPVQTTPTAVLNDSRSQINVPRT